AYYAKVVMMPKYKTSIILKSKYIKIDQLNRMFSKFDACLADNDINQTDPNLAKIFKNAHILKFNIEEMNADPRDKSEKFRMYNLTMISAKKPEKNISTAIDSAIAAIQQEFADENEIQENVNSISVAIADIDSLIAVAIKAGKGLGNRMEGNNQTTFASDIYKGTNDIILQKESYQKQLSFFAAKNLIFKTSPYIISKKIETPIIIFAIGLIVWTLISILWIGASMIYNSEE
ncbi:MAG: hypothetical protein KA797_06700, partial [Chitinophagales bacterium]|nr:hypothetical protein [Chitinophagales bacterium]